MKDHVILITGALAGIGRATALAAADEGYEVVVSGRNSQTGEALESELRARGTEALFLRADIRHESDVQDLIDGAIARFGRVDVAVNNAGTRFTGSQERKAGLLASIPLRRAGRPEELADAILFLASDKDPFVTGQINGGRTVS